ncbi:GyrI-like domain-containing protein [Flavobacterium hibernum]|uniref:Transcriptional regulator n=1 Tax=Flavobacterium hibernum TaxID=37752 RepID=A0A0D0EDI7_9FLAO|nr:effector binding domain-containing protein [Flavobacterium hibernum]KIO50674.1 transcriptional regulator [Flavobacterium hibernum]OXA87542.1 AraC family transcriptional regulator [Flavobacterium hibernum]STO14415.1 Bacterial transcription activator, effector binding domain [Flavobacterium hibernum]
MDIQKFNIIGISIRTTNENEQSGKDIPALWDRFISEGIAEKIPNKINHSIYSVYTDYEKDHTKPYTTILGCAVESLDLIPEEMVGITIETAYYEKFIAKGNLNDGIVINEWIKIWNSDLNRSFTSDFEIYGEKAQNPENAEVDIFIAINR